MATITKTQQAQKQLVVCLFQEIWNEGKLGMFDAISTPNFTVHFAEGMMKGRKALTDVISAWRTAFPDIHHTITDYVYAGDKIIVQWKGEGTHKGIFQGFLPSGRKMHYSGMTIFKVKANKLTDAWVASDVFKILDAIRVYSNKKYSDKDFSVDFKGPAGKIYRWFMKARPVPSCKQKIADALRDMFAVVPLDNKPEFIIPPELFSQVVVKEKSIPYKKNKVRALIYQPKNKTKPLLPAIIYMHGGGWSIGAAEDADLLSRKLALMSESMVINLDYRLAPEYPYPNGLDDCMAAYYWVREQAGQLNIDPNKVIVAGDSCGGNFALAMALRARDEGKKMPDAILALCPLTDFIFEKYDSARKHGPNSLVYDFAFLSFVRSIYSPYDEWQHPYISPMYGDLRNFPPTLILAAGQDLLVDENKVFAQKLKAAGNEKVELLVQEAMPHAYYYFLGLCKEEDLAYHAMAKFIKNVL